MKRHRFEQNVLFHLNKTMSKKALFPNQSLFFNLFNKVLNCNFYFKNQFNCIHV
jgi:hypothetical protein